MRRTTVPRINRRVTYVARIFGTVSIECDHHSGDITRWDNTMINPNTEWFLLWIVPTAPNDDIVMSMRLRRENRVRRMRESANITGTGSQRKNGKTVR